MLPSIIRGLNLNVPPLKNLTHICFCHKPEWISSSVLETQAQKYITIGVSDTDNCDIPINQLYAEII